MAIDIHQPSPLLDQFCAAHPAATATATAEITLSATPSGLHCVWNTAPGRPLNFFIDIDKFTGLQRSYPAARQQPFCQALGKKTKRIIDATAGWGNDSLLLCTLGFQVTVLERNPIMCLLLSDAMHRLAATSWAQDNNVPIPSVIQANAIEFLQTETRQVDCVYVDPMFPPKRKRSAEVNKNMQFLKWLVGEDKDAPELVYAALNSASRRVVVKRPGYARPLVDIPSQRFSGKLVSYDVYLNASPRTYV